MTLAIGVVASFFTADLRDAHVLVAVPRAPHAAQSLSHLRGSEPMRIFQNANYPFLAVAPARLRHHRGAVLVGPSAHDRPLRQRRGVAELRRGLHRRHAGAGALQQAGDRRPGPRRASAAGQGDWEITGFGTEQRVPHPQPEFGQESGARRADAGDGRRWRRASSRRRQPTFGSCAPRRWAPRRGRAASSRALSPSSSRSRPRWCTWRSGSSGASARRGHRDLATTS